MRWLSVVVISLVSMTSLCFAEPPKQVASDKLPISMVDNACTQNRPVKPASAPAANAPRYSAEADGTQSVSVYCGDNAVQTAMTPIGGRPRKDELHFFDAAARLFVGLAWPLVVLLLGWRLGPELRRKVFTLRKLKAGSLEVEFDKEVAALREEVDAALPAATNSEPISNEVTHLLNLAKVSPRAAIIEAWRAVEVAAFKAIDSRDSNSRDEMVPSQSQRNRNPFTVGRQLGRLEILDGQFVSVFNEMRNLRNQATHDEGFESSFEAANNYIQLAESLRLKFREAIERDLLRRVQSEPK